MAVYHTYKAAKASLQEFTPWLRKAHTIVRFYSNQDGCYKYCRVLSSNGVKKNARLRSRRSEA